ncbi:MAG: hypothetical protein U5K76_02650 [Woeseiaceae bacterium]|nr:hypothetical protein [Woeseiaceae bacterium]
MNNPAPGQSRVGDPYNAAVRALFAEPRHAGVAGGPAVTVERGGVRIELGARLAGRDLAELRFRAFGCPHVIAALERFCAGHEGRPCADLQNFSVAGTMDALEIPVGKTGRILLVEDAIHALYQRLAADMTAGE